MKMHKNFFHKTLISERIMQLVFCKVIFIVDEIKVYCTYFEEKVICIRLEALASKKRTVQLNLYRTYAAGKR